MRESNLQLSLFISGVLLLFASGGFYLTLELRAAALERVERGLQHGKRIFVTIERAQKKESPRGTVSYFFSYATRHEGRRLESDEEVAAPVYHLYSEGKNIEAVVYQDGSGQIHTRLRANLERRARDDLGDLWTASLVGGLGGLVLIGLGLGLGALRKLK